MKKCLFCVFLGIFILVISGIFVARSIFANKYDQAKCDDVIEKMTLMRGNFDKSCNLDSDCSDFVTPYSCSLCINKANDVTEYNKYQTEAVNNDCIPAKGCMPAKCVCINNVCVKKRLEQDK